VIGVGGRSSAAEVGSTLRCNSSDGLRAWSCCVRLLEPPTGQSTFVVSVCPCVVCWCCGRPFGRCQGQSRASLASQRGLGTLWQGRVWFVRRLYPHEHRHAAAVAVVVVVDAYQVGEWVAAAGRLADGVLSQVPNCATALTRHRIVGPCMRCACTSTHDALSDPGVVTASRGSTCGQTEYRCAMAVFLL
jgi:hypothetical protein